MKSLFTTWQWCVCGYRSSSGIFLAVVLSSYPQHILHTVIKLWKAIELAVAEVDGSLEKKWQEKFICGFNFLGTFNINKHCHEYAMFSLKLILMLLILITHLFKGKICDYLLMFIGVTTIFAPEFELL